MVTMLQIIFSTFNQRLISRAILAVILTAAFDTSYGQDIHFSQYFNNPLSVNPALTGKMNGTFRLGVDYRNQWAGIGSKTYSTPSFYGDVPIRFKSKDVLGLGLNIVSDKSSGGMLSSFSGVLSTAFHKAMGSSKNHFFSLGIQIGFLQKRLDLSRVRLGDQIELQTENISITPDMSAVDGNDGGFEFNAGFDWSSKFSERVIMHAGYAAVHLTQPEIKFYSAQKLPVRHTFSFEPDFGLARHFWLHPYFLYMTQANATEVFTGASMGIPFNDHSGMYLGAYARLSDAIAPYLGFDIKGVKVGLSYDITTSSLNEANGGFEISLTYTGRYVPVPDVVPALYCPRFY